MGPVSVGWIVRFGVGFGVVTTKPTNEGVDSGSMTEDCVGGEVGYGVILFLGLGVGKEFVCTNSGTSSILNNMFWNTFLRSSRTLASTA